MTPHHECRIKDLSRCSPTFTLDIPWAMIYVPMARRDLALCKIEVPPPAENRVSVVGTVTPFTSSNYCPSWWHDTTGVNYMTTSMKLTILGVLNPLCSYMAGPCISKKHRWTNMCFAPRAVRFARYFILLYNQECFRWKCQYEHSQYKRNEKLCGVFQYDSAMKQDWIRRLHIYKIIIFLM